MRRGGGLILSECDQGDESDVIDDPPDLGEGGRRSVSSKTSRSRRGAYPLTWAKSRCFPCFWHENRQASRRARGGQRMIRMLKFVLPFPRWSSGSNVGCRSREAWIGDSAGRAGTRDRDSLNRSLRNSRLDGLGAGRPEARRWKRRVRFRHLLTSPQPMIIVLPSNTPTRRRL